MLSYAVVLLAEDGLGPAVVAGQARARGRVGSHGGAVERSGLQGAGVAGPGDVGDWSCGRGLARGRHGGGALDI